MWFVPKEWYLSRKSDVDTTAQLSSVIERSAQIYSGIIQRYTHNGKTIFSSIGGTPISMIQPFAKILETFISFPPSGIYSYFEKGCRKTCTRQTRKVLWVVLSSLLFKEIWKNGTRGHGRMFARAKGKRVRQLQCQEQCIDHIPYYLSDCGVHFFPTSFLEIAVYILLTMAYSPVDLISLKDRA